MKNKNTLKKQIVLDSIIFVLLLMLTTSVASIKIKDNAPYVDPVLVWVDDDFDENTPGWGYDHFKTIQDGIDGVYSGGCVFVAQGTYRERIEINKYGISLIGSASATPIIHGYPGTQVPPVVMISGYHAKINGFTIIDGDSDHISTLIYVNSTYNTISNNKLKLVEPWNGWSWDYESCAIYLAPSSNNNSINNNYITAIKHASCIILENSNDNL